MKFLVDTLKYYIQLTYRMFDNIMLTTLSFLVTKLLTIVSNQITLHASHYRLYWIKGLSSATPQCGVEPLTAMELGRCKT